MPLDSTTDSRIQQFLRGKAPFSVLERGRQAASSGQVIECSRQQAHIQGVVQEAAPATLSEGSESSPTETPQTFSVAITIVSGSEAVCRCTCCPPEDLEDQWCHHTVALLMRAADLGFLEPKGGFVDPNERALGRTPEDIASVIRDLAAGRVLFHEPARVNAQVAISLNVNADRLGVQVRFDGRPEHPAVFDELVGRSARALDTILLQILNEEGAWDEEGQLWYVSSSHGIELALGLIREYPMVTTAEGTSITFAPTTLDAELILSWREDGSLELSMEWIMPGTGERVLRAEDLMGTGPHWVMLSSTLYRVSSRASRIASVIPVHGITTMTRSRVGPILEAIEGLALQGFGVTTRNLGYKPRAEIAEPKPLLELERNEPQHEHFASHRTIELKGRLLFEYPAPPEDENLVYLPNRAKEMVYREQVITAGFSYEENKDIFRASGDTVLELLSSARTTFAAPWTVRGLETVAKGVRISELKLSIAITSETPSPEERAKRRTGFYDCEVKLLQNSSHIPLSSLFKTPQPDTSRWIRLDNGSYGRIPGGALGALKMALGLLDPGFRLKNTIRSRLTTAQALSFARFTEQGLEVRLEERVQRLAHELRDLEAIPEVTPSSKFKAKLRPYQLDGLRWLMFLRKLELGGILADEMGLGKTVQALGLIQLLADEAKKANKKTHIRPTLVIAPTSVITNWLHEAQRFTPTLKVMVLHGLERKELFAQIPECDLVITSYALLRLDRAELEKHRFQYLILDEAQNIKNHETATTKAAKAIRATYRLVLTGTPTENRPMELWSIMDFLMPGYLGSSDFFRSYIERPILENGPRAEVLSFLNAKTKPFLLRRTKAEVERDLPPKIESTLYAEMTPEQREIYTQVLADIRPKLMETVREMGIRRATVSILAALMRLRQICNHPASLDGLRDIPNLESGKFNVFKELVTEALASGRKILVFAQFREMLAIMHRWLETQGVKHCYLDGSTRDRQAIIDDFNNDPSISMFLISLKAGGTGLNLTAADTVVIYDPWWNPAVEHQAVDRAHRIGQTKTVSVYRLITEGSIEQKIMDMKSRKSQIVDALINDTGLRSLSLSKKELEELFSL